MTRFVINMSKSLLHYTTITQPPAASVVVSARFPSRIMFRKQQRIQQRRPYGRTFLDGGGGSREYKI